MSAVPTRVRLGASLRASRRAAGITQSSLAARLGVSQSMISKIETGETRAAEAVLLAWLDETDVEEPTRAELIGLSGETTDIADWPQLFSRGWAAHQKSYTQLEQGATTICSFQNAVIPGLLQTSAYTSFLLATVVGLSPEDVGVAVTSRLSRQEILYRPGTRLRVVLAEAVLRHQLGGPAVMPEQLRRIAELAQLPTVELGVIPIETTMASRYGVSFDLFDDLHGSGESLVVVELESGEVREEHPERIAAYRRRHAIYWAAALTGEAATGYVNQLADEMTSRLFR